MNWLILFVAGLFEICWAVGLKLSHGLTRPAWAVFTVVTLVLSMGLLAYASRSLPIGTAYAVWTGIGVVGTAALGILFLGEPRDVIRLLFLALIVVGIVGLRLVSDG
ncbi:MAG TPA: quaternary ammonium compound efflux SMR transporter SugE [Longimicrobiaceae bacterium]|nr:quaternary ammonium compound efflux SMR transporter SugE [Longimicrobiaceae bacterium]